MSRELRILHLADTHIGAGLPSRPRVDRPRRGDDLVSSYRAALQRAREHEVDLVIHAGDVFDRPDPSGPAMTAAATPLLELASEGVHVAIVPGNHERSVLPGSLLLQHPRIHVFTEPATLRLKLQGRQVAVVGVPCIRRGVTDHFDEALAGSNWPRQRGDVNVLVLHQALDTAEVGPVGFRFRSGADVLDRARLPKGFDYVALGHVHRQQDLDVRPGCPVTYSGSTDRISFAERDEPKGCNLVREVGGRLETRFIEHNVRPMRMVPLDVTGVSREQLLERIAAALCELPLGAYVSLRLSGAADPGALLRLRLSRRVASWRPDLMVRLSLQQVELVPEHGRAQRRRVMEDPLAALPPLHGRALELPIDRLSEMPNRCGTYLLRDANGRVIYVGKSKHVRTRIRSHLRPRSNSNCYAGWSEQVRSVLVRPAESELEALIAEAELVRRVRPAFNRQMRMWSRYCYLTDSDRPHEPLQVSKQPPEAGRCFGPYRSRFAAEDLRLGISEVLGLAECPEQHDGLPLLPAALQAGAGAAQLCERYFDGACSGPCAGRITTEHYANRLQVRDALLRGKAEAEPLVNWYEQLAERAEALVDTETEAELRGRVRRLQRTAVTLRDAFERGRMLRAALTVRRHLLLLPDDGGELTWVLSLVETPLRPRRLPLVDEDWRALERLTERAGRQPTINKQEFDLLSTIVRYLRDNPAAGGL